MANAEVGANNIINQLKSIHDAIAIVHDSYGKMLTTDKLSDFNVMVFLRVWQEIQIGFLIYL